MVREVLIAPVSAGETLLASARAGEHGAFGRLTEPHYRELHLHCYRMLGSFDDAEDLVQEVLLRAWRSLDRFEGRASFRAWLYRIATNACLDALAKRPLRISPAHRGPAANPAEPPRPFVEKPIWLQPYPDTLLDELPDPEARYAQRETVELAFLAAIQLLPPRQRAVLLLRDVLVWNAREAAQLLDASVASVNSALQRARATLAEGRAAPVPMDRRRPSPEERFLLDQYMRAFDEADVPSLVRLLRDDVIMTMPPDPAWFSGREAVGEFLSRWVFPLRGPLRLVPIGANRQPGFAIYELGDDGKLDALAIHILRLEDAQVAEISGFVGPDLFRHFGLSLVG